jgi:hypothetical protein
MRNAMQWLGQLFLAIVTLTICAPQAARAAAADPGDAALAEHLTDTARMTLTAKYLTPAHYRLAGALLEGAVKLQPNEPRYSRLWADAMLQIRNKELALKALGAYIAVEPDDRQAMIQLADLHAGSYETIDKRLEYLRDWVDDARLPEEVRSHIAFLASQAYLERSQLPQSKKMLDQAQKLNPLSMEVLRVRYSQLEADGTPYERITTLLEILKSNPAQIPYVYRLGEELSAAGLPQPAMQFLALGFGLANRQGMSVGREPAMAYATDLLLMNQPAAAKQLIDQLTAGSPDDFQLLALRLLAERAGDLKEPADKTLGQLQNVLLNRLQLIRQTMGNKTATTRPIDSPAPSDLGSFEEDIKQLKEHKSADGEKIRGAYTQVLVEMAWVETYFRKAPADAKPIIDAIKQLVPDNDASIARLEGWGFLMRDQADQARVKLSAVKDQDVLAELGLVKLMDPAAAKAEGEKLLARHPAGLTALLILDALRAQKVGLVPDPQAVAPLVEAITKFPAAWFGILEQPQNFYSLKLEPVVPISHNFGEPILVRVTLHNMGEYPLTLGADGVIHADLWFEADFRGVMQQSLPAAAYDQMRHEVILKPHASVSQVVRVDQGQMLQLLSSSPFPAMQINMKVRTNPSAASSTGLSPAGQIAQGGKYVERNSFAYSPASLQKLATAMQQGGPAEKIYKTDLLSAVIQILAQQPGDEPKQRVAQIVELLRAAARDPSPAVATWATVTAARLSSPQERTSLVSHLVNDPYWAARLLGMSSMGPLPISDQQKIVSSVAAHDTDPVVVAYAKAMGELLDMAAAAAAQAATQPTSQPATGPSTSPVAPLPGVGPAGPANPLSPPTTKPAGPDLVIPSVPFTLPPANPPAGQP